MTGKNPAILIGPSKLARQSLGPSPVMPTFGLLLDMAIVGAPRKVRERSSPSTRRKSMRFVGLYLTIALPFMGAAHSFAQDSPSRVNTQPSTRVLPAPSATEVKRGANAIKIPKSLAVPPEWIPLLNRA